MGWRSSVVATLAITALVAFGLAALMVRPGRDLSTRNAVFELDEPATSGPR
jgi:hypothetical protein